MVIIDADNGRDVVNFLKVKAFPTLCSFVDGNLCHSVVGAVDKEILEFFKVTVHKYMEK
jgi:thioredoxin-like negative regulator of GroEL